MREEPGRLVVASQTGRGVTRVAVILLALLASSCLRTESPAVAYAKTRAAFFRGDLDLAVASASVGAAGWKSDRNSPWFWRFRLLQAEALTLQYKNEEAAALLKEPVPPGPASSQLEVQRLIDQANLPGADAAKLLKQARAAATDPELEIRIILSEGALRRNDDDAGE